MWNKCKPYAISIVIALGVGALSAFATRGSMETFAQLNKPPLTPPGWLFPLVWTVLFLLMGISAAMVYRSQAPNKSRALWVYAIQLAVNFCWSILFFNLQAYCFAFVWLLLLLTFIVVMIRLFDTVSAAAARLQLPYVLWVAFAGYLNLAICLLN